MGTDILHRAECVRTTKLATLWYLCILHQLFGHHSGAVDVCGWTGCNPRDWMAALFRPQYICFSCSRCTRASIWNCSGTCCRLIRLAAHHQLSSGWEWLSLAEISVHCLLLHFEELSSSVFLMRHHEVFVIIVYLVVEVLRLAIERWQTPTIFLWFRPVWGFRPDRRLWGRILAVQKILLLISLECLSLIEPCYVTLSSFQSSSYLLSWTQTVWCTHRKLVELVSSAHFRIITNKL